MKLTKYLWWLENYQYFDFISASKQKTGYKKASLNLKPAMEMYYPRVIYPRMGNWGAHATLAGLVSKHNKSMALPRMQIFNPIISIALKICGMDDISVSMFLDWSLSDGIKSWVYITK